MAKLICADDIEKLIKQGEKRLYLEKDTVLTPSAKDAANAADLELCEGGPDSACAAAAGNGDSSACDGEISSDLIYNALKQMDCKDLLNKLSGETPTPELPYSAETGSGVKLVCGKSVRMDFLDTGTPGVKACYQELISDSDGAHIPSGFLEIDCSEFEWELEGYEEVDYIIEGTLSITINGETFTGHAGDVFFVPSGSKVVWCSPDKARMFYSTYPVN
ncbi:MAG: hypothetical protein B6230_07290 [Desulfobacteraceae bacterium 4572_89]|nr:MAG: hypothetical protein B6230_07290 [Desulfobacteraceae bacterium 4572_89]